MCGQSRRLQSIGICFTLYAQIILVKGITLGVNNEAFVALRSEPSNYNNISLPLPCSIPTVTNFLSVFLWCVTFAPLVLMFPQNSENTYGHG